MFGRLRILTEPRFWVFALMGLGGLWLAWVVLAAAQRPGSDPGAIRAAARAVDGFIATDPARPVPPYPLIAEDGGVRLDRLRDQLALVQVNPRRCTNCATQLDALSALDVPAGVNKWQLSLKGEPVRAVPGVSPLQDDIGSFDRFLPPSTRQAVILVVDTQRGTEVGRLIGTLRHDDPATHALIRQLHTDTLRR